jgi:hypothetical protein
LLQLLLCQRKCTVSWFFPIGCELITYCQLLTYCVVVVVVVATTADVDPVCIVLLPKPVMMMMLTLMLTFAFDVALLDNRYGRSYQPVRCTKLWCPQNSPLPFLAHPWLLRFYSDQTLVGVYSRHQPGCVLRSAVPTWILHFMQMTLCILFGVLRIFLTTQLNGSYYLTDLKLCSFIC